MDREAGFYMEGWDTYSPPITLLLRIVMSPDSLNMAISEFKFATRSSLQVSQPLPSRTPKDVELSCIGLISIQASADF